MAEVGCLAIPGFLFHDTPEMVRPGDAHGSPGTECHRAAFNQGPRNRYGQSPDSVSRALRFLGAALVTQFPKEKALHYGGRRASPVPLSQGTDADRNAAHCPPDY